MSKRRSRKPLPFWVSEAPSGEERFVQIGGSLLRSDAFQSLGAAAFHLYICMAYEAAGEREFIFTAKAAERYGISNRTFFRAVQQLEDAGFIERRSGRNLRAPNEYAFSREWRRPPASVITFPHCEERKNSRVDMV